MFYKDACTRNRFIQELENWAFIDTILAPITIT